MMSNEYTTTASATSTTTPPRRGCETVRMVGVPTTQELSEATRQNLLWIFWLET